MSGCCERTVPSASGAGGSNRAASYACIAGLPNFHHEIRRVFPARELGRVNPRGRSHGACAGLFFYAQMNSSSLGERERLNRPEGALAEDGIDSADHVGI